MSNNIEGFYNIIYSAQMINVKHFLFASSSSVYGDQNTFPLKENFISDQPLSFYAASKKSNELIAHSFSNIYKIPCSALRFFTVYGPYGRPDMALYKFTDSILNNKKINLYNKGNHVRDFTFIDDVINYIVKLIPKFPKGKMPFEVYNIASGKPKTLRFFLKKIEESLNKKSMIKKIPMQKGDVYKTHADIKKIKIKLNMCFYTKLEIGIEKFTKWFKEYNK